jgi:CO/xanthine dehydrogenase Mo-binding subunit
LTVRPETYQAISACGIGEPATIPMTAAVASAVYKIGIRLRALLMTPAVVLAALNRVPSRI